MRKIGFIGLGTMGLPMASNILKGGYELIVYDANPKQAELFAENKGVIAAANPREVGERCDVCITMVPTPEIVKDVAIGMDGLFSGMDKGKVWIDMSTSDPVITKLLGEKAVELGIHPIDAPVARSSAEAVTGKLMIMVGGDRSVYEDIKAILDLLGNDIFYCGELGTGHTMKIVNNLLGMIVIAANSEALVLGTKAGLSLETMLSVISKTNVWNRHLENTFPGKVFAGNFEPGYKTVLAEKDLGLAKQLARSVNVPLLCGMTVREMMAGAIAEGFGDQDFTSLIRPLERVSGVEVRSRDTGTV